MAEPGRVRRLLRILRAECPADVPRPPASARSSVSASARSLAATPVAGGPVPVAGRVGSGRRTTTAPPMASGAVVVPVSIGAAPSGQGYDDLPWYEQRGAEVLAELGFDWTAHLPGWT